MSDNFIAQVMDRVSQNVQLANVYLNAGRMTDAQRHAQRASNLMILLADVRLVLAVPQLKAAPESCVSVS